MAYTRKTFIIRKPAFHSSRGGCCMWGASAKKRNLLHGVSLASKLCENQWGKPPGWKTPDRTEPPCGFPQACLRRMPVGQCKKPVGLSIPILQARAPRHRRQSGTWWGLHDPAQLLRLQGLETHLSAPSLFSRGGPRASLNKWGFKSQARGGGLAS